MRHPSRTTVWVIVTLLVVVSAVLPSRVSAQYYAEWSCRGSSQCATVMGGSSGRTGPFDSMAECRAWGDDQIPHGYHCEAGASSSEARPDTPLASTIIGTTVFTLGGATVGNFTKDADGKGEWAAGGAVGFGTGLLVDVLRNRRNRPRLASMIEGAAAGAAVGAGVGMHQDGRLVSGSAADKATASKMGTDAAIGAGVGLAAGFVAPALESRLVPRLGRLLGPARVVSLLYGGRRVGMVVSW